MWCLWRSWLARQIVALEAESSNLSRHPTKDRTGAFLHGLFFYNGSSPSGKARDFDSRIREFEPRRPNHSSSCMNVQGELLFCRGDHWSPADACGSGKPSGRIWNPPLRRRGRRPRRPGEPAAALALRAANGRPYSLPLAPSARGLRPQAVGERTVRLPEIFRAMAKFSPSAPSGHRSPSGASATSPPYRGSLSRRGRFYFFQSNVGMGLDPSAPLAAVG